MTIPTPVINAIYRTGIHRGKSIVLHSLSSNAPDHAAYAVPATHVLDRSPS